MMGRLGKRWAQKTCPPYIGWDRGAALGLWIALWMALMCVNHGVSAAPAPATVAGIQLGTSDNDVTLSWSAATTNLYGDTLAADHYNVYRGTTPGFVPDYAGGSNRIAQSTTTNFTDTGALAGTESYFYHVTAVSADGTESLVPSSIAYKLRLDDLKSAILSNPDLDLAAEIATVESELTAIFAENS